MSTQGFTISDGLGKEFPVIDDDALHLTSYFADASGNGRINASDASQVARFAALLENGFASSVLTDPIIVGDISGNGRINAADASLVARFAALIEVPEIPPIPGGVVIAGGGAPPGIGHWLLIANRNTNDRKKAPAPVRGSASDSADTTFIYYPAIDAVMADLASCRVKDLLPILKPVRQFHFPGIVDTASLFWDRHLDRFAHVAMSSIQLERF